MDGVEVVSRLRHDRLYEVDAHCAAEARLNGLGRQADTKLVELALTKIEEAQRMAGQLNQDANALAAEASKAINDVLNTP